MKLDRRQRLLALAAATVVGLFAAERLLINPLWKSWSARATRLATIQKDVADGNNLLRSEKSIRERWQTRRAQMLTNDVSAAENQLLKAVDRWSQDSRITILAVKPQWKSADDEFTTLDLRVDALGNMAAVTRLLYNVENASQSQHDPVALKVDFVEISARGDNGDQLALALQVSGLVFNPKKKR